MLYLTHVRLDGLYTHTHTLTHVRPLLLIVLDPREKITNILYIAQHIFLYIAIFTFIWPEHCPLKKLKVYNSNVSYYHFYRTFYVQLEKLLLKMLNFLSLLNIIIFSLINAKKTRYFFCLLFLRSSQTQIHYVII